MRLLFIALMMLPNPSLRAGFDFNDRCVTAYSHIISLRFSEGIRLLEEEKKANPSNDIPHYLENYIDFLSAFLSEEEKDLKKLTDGKSRRLARLGKSDKTSPYYLYTQAEILLQHAFVRAKFKEYYGAALEVHRAFKLLNENAGKFPSFLPNYKCLGFLHALVGAVPEEYKWLSTLVGMKGTIRQGVEELTRVLKAEPGSAFVHFREEALFLLTFIELNLESDPERAHWLLPYYDNPANLLLVFSRASIFLHTGSNDEALKVLLSRPAGEEYSDFHYLEYMTGVARLNRLDLGASENFLRFLGAFHGLNYKKAAWQKLAWCSLLSGKTDKYREYIQSCGTVGNNMVDEDKQALKEQQSGIIPNPVLLRARLLFDGGYYHRAAGELAGKPIETFPTLRDKLEVTYRMGRIFYELGDHAKALHYYELTLKNGEKYPYYFAANAALQMGLVYEQMKNREKARFYFKKCLSMRNHEYQNSIDQKAEAGMNRTEEK